MRQKEKKLQAQLRTWNVYVTDTGEIQCYDKCKYDESDNDVWTFASLPGRRHTFGELMDAAMKHIKENHKKDE